MDQMSLPPATPDDAAPDSGSDLPELKSVSLTPEQLDALGLTDCQPGDSYTIQITKTDDGADGAPMFSIDSSEPAQPEGGEEPPDLSPDVSPEDSVSPDGENGAADEVLGYTRKKKTPRDGLPDTKKMRDF